MKSAVGILGMGSYLPEQVRGNDWWSPSLVARWREKRNHNLPSMSRWAEGPVAPGESPGAGVEKVIATLLALGDDPFQGARERRVAPDDMTASEMETRAARIAMERAGVDASQIDFVLSYSAVPDYLLTINACAIHKSLGLNSRCLSLAVEGACNTFLSQLSVAEQLVAGGQFRCGLLVQSSLCTRVVPSEQPASALFGDGATAVVVGPVKDGFGILGRAHQTDGTRFKACVIGVPGKRWYDEGRTVFYTEDAQLGRGLILSIADHSRQIIHDALAEARCGVDDVDFYACHQGTVWLRELTQKHAGLDCARSIDTFAWATSLMGVNVPLVLAVADREGALKSGDLVSAFSGGLGETWSSMVLRWGRG